MKLAGPVSTNKLVTLDTKDVGLEVNRTLKIVGWGENHEHRSNLLLQADVEIIDPEECYNSFRESKSLLPANPSKDDIASGKVFTNPNLNKIDIDDSFQYESELCAGRPRTCTTAANHDSGSPIFYEPPNQMPIIVGVTSYGRPREECKFSAYVRLSKYTEWIESEINNIHKKYLVCTLCNTLNTQPEIHN